MTTTTTTTTAKKSTLPKKIADHGPNGLDERRHKVHGGGGSPTRRRVNLRQKALTRHLIVEVGGTERRRQGMGSRAGRGDRH